MSELRTLLLGEDNGWIFLLECAVRAVLMFLFALALMKVTGKKEVRQFSVLELIVIIGLGSALGDPMIYTDAPLLPSSVAIGVVLFCYWALNKWTNRAPHFEAFIEGRVTRVLHEGIIDLPALDAEGMSPAEFFGDLRVEHVEHLGQVKCAYVEIDGELSIFFHAHADVKPGLPIAPESLAEAAPLATMRAFPCCCARCGYLVAAAGSDTCAVCHNREWVRADQRIRVA